MSLVALNDSDKDDLQPGRNIHKRIGPRLILSSIWFSGFEGTVTAYTSCVCRKKAELNYFSDELYEVEAQWLETQQQAFRFE